MDDYSPTPSIRAKAAACQQCFEACIECLPKPLSEGFETQLGRLNIWSLDTLVNSYGTESIDHRLRSNPYHRGLILDLLEVIQQKLEHVKQLAQNHALQLREEATQSSKRIGEDITHLRRLSVILRSFFDNDAFKEKSRLVGELADDGEFLSNAKHCLKRSFPRANELIVDHLATAIRLRTMEVKISRSFHQSQVASKGSEWLSAEGFGESTSQAVQRATDISSSSVEITIRNHFSFYPFILANNHISIICPYCSSMILVTDIPLDRLMRDHVERDLFPFVCLYQGCSLSGNEILFSRRQQWVDHIREHHRRRWSCKTKSHYHQFTSQNEYKKHLEESHGKSLTRSQIQLFSSAKTRELTTLFDSCPLCDKSDIPPDELEEHIAEHLLQVALLCIPPPERAPTFDTGKSNDTVVPLFEIPVGIQGSVVLVQATLQNIIVCLDCSGVFEEHKKYLQKHRKLLYMLGESCYTEEARESITAFDTIFSALASLQHPIANIAFEILAFVSVLHYSEFPISFFKEAWEGLCCASLHPNGLTRLTRLHVNHACRIIPEKSLTYYGTRIQQAIGLLEATGLISKGSEGDTLFTSPLIHDWIKGRLNQERHELAWNVAGSIIAFTAQTPRLEDPLPSRSWRMKEGDIWPHFKQFLENGKKLYLTDMSKPVDLKIWYSCAYILLHTRRDKELSSLLSDLLRRLGEISEFPSIEKHWPLYWIKARNLQHLGLYSLSVSLWKRIHEFECGTTSTTHQGTMKSRHELASASRLAGKVTEASALITSVVRAENMTSTQDVLSSLASQHEQAVIYLHRQEFDKSLLILKVVVSKEEEILPIESPSRLASLHELACAYYYNKHLKRALTLFDEVAEVRAKTLRMDHPDRIATDACRTVVRRDIGVLGEAQKQESQTMPRRVLIEEHEIFKLIDWLTAEQSVPYFEAAMSLYLEDMGWKYLRFAMEVSFNLLRSIPERHPDKDLWLEKLSSALTIAHMHTSQPEAFDTAVSVSSRLARPSSDPVENALLRIRHLKLLLLRFEHLGVNDELESGLEAAKQATALLALDDPLQQEFRNLCSNAMAGTIPPRPLLQHINRLPANSSRPNIVNSERTYHIVGRIPLDWLRLGTIVDSLYDMQTLNQDEEFEIEQERLYCKHESLNEVARAATLKGKAGIALKLSSGGDQRGVDESCSPDKLDTLFFHPKRSDYMAAIQQSQGLLDFVRSSNHKPVYMITGLKTAWQSKAIDISRAYEAKIGITMGVKQAGFSLGPGLNTAKPEIVSQGSEETRKEEYIFAVRVSKLSYRRSIIGLLSSRSNTGDQRVGVFRRTKRDSPKDEEFDVEELELGEEELQYRNVQETEIDGEKINWVFCEL